MYIYYQSESGFDPELKAILGCLRHHEITLLCEPGVRIDCQYVVLSVCWEKGLLADVYLLSHEGVGIYLDYW